ncbi:MAG: SUMF1/EgtB/PvdO family nonheme iron enzyme [Planctomycetes bacterium]|nr:SUMF1/EgtB/PvdO family nonheme iron enzyme [Planctomycetota bacterium]
MWGAIVDDRARGHFLDAIRRFLPTNHIGHVHDCHMAFRAHFLGMPTDDSHNTTCLLLDAAAQQDVKQVVALVNSSDTSTASHLNWLFPAGDHSTLLQSRLSILRAVASDAGTDTIQEVLLNAVRGYATAMNSRPSAPGTSPGRSRIPQFLLQFQERRELDHWTTLLEAVERAWRQECQRGDEPDWDDPALLMLGQTLAYVLFRGEMPVEGAPVATWVLLAAGEQIERPSYRYLVPVGLVARLVIEKVPNGGGLLYPDCRYGGYQPVDDSFQQGLRNVMTVLRGRADWVERGGDQFDFRWRLIPFGPPDSEHESPLPILLQQIRGRSAEVAFACAIRALLWNERLDAHFAVSACFEDPTKPHGRLEQVLGIVEKRQGVRSHSAATESEAALKIRQIDGIVLAGERPEADDLGWIEPRIYRVPTFDKAYRQLSDYCRMADKLKCHLKTRADELLEATCAPYVPSSLSRRRRGDPLKKEPDVVFVPLEPAEIATLLQGDDVGTRTRLLGESGLGKSTILIDAETSVAGLPDNRIPIRLGAGPACCARDGLNRWVRLPLLSDFHWDGDASVFMEQLAERLFGEYLPDRQERNAFIAEVVRRGDACFLFDAIDQTDGTLKLAKFLKSDGIRNCPVLLSGRPETQQTKTDSFAEVTWDTVWMDPFDDERIRKFWGAAPLLDRLLENQDWEALRTVPVLLQQMRRLALAGHLENLPNREAVYDRTLQMLVQHGKDGTKDAGHQEIFDKDLKKVVAILSEIAWETIQRESSASADEGGNFTGVLEGDAYSALLDHHKNLLGQLDQLNLTTRQTYLDEFNLRHEQFAWRHFSFCEWFAGLHLAKLPETEQSTAIQDHGRDPRWGSILRFALGAAQREKKTSVVNHLATSLLKSGAPFVLWKSVDEDGIRPDKELDNLCRWLVHRSRTSWKNNQVSPWDGRTVQSRPHLNGRTAPIVRSLFAIDEDEPWQRRDSRWLHAAWQLVVDGAVSSLPEVRRNCKEIQHKFLSEFERRVESAALRYRGWQRSDWERSDRGLLQLVPDEVLVELGLMTPEQLRSIRYWPIVDPATGPSSYEQRRDQFDQALKSVGANYCQCPPEGWEHQYPNDNGSTRDPRECLIGEGGRRTVHVLPANHQLQRTPVTNIQFEAFDPSHRSLRHREWRRPEESEEEALDNHPVVDVTWYEAVMLAVYLTGNGRFGTFELPFENDWEADCRAGRDQPDDKYGIAWCDENQQPILDAQGREQFDSLSSYGANFDGTYSDGEAKAEPYREGTIPVGQFPANGFGLVDMHGQVYEWMQNSYESRNRAQKGILNLDSNDVCVRGGSWGDDAGGTQCSDRDWFAPADRDSVIGVRLTRTP